MGVQYSRYESPVGELLLVAREGAPSGVYFEGHRRGPRVGPDWRVEARPLEDVRAWLDRYFDDPAAVSVPALPAGVGTPFQRRVWGALRAIPVGQTRTYGELAKALGVPGGARAVGAANARNPLSIMVPCHRVVGADGRLTGYAGGAERKRWLLDHERGLH